MNITLTPTEAGIICFLIVMVIWILIDTLKERNREKRCLEMNIDSWEKVCEGKNEEIRNLQQSNHALNTECTDLHEKLEQAEDKIIKQIDPPIPTLYCIVDTSRIRPQRNAVHRWYHKNRFENIMPGVWSIKMPSLGYVEKMSDSIKRHAFNHGYTVMVFTGTAYETVSGNVKTYDYPEAEATC